MKPSLEIASKGWILAILLLLHFNVLGQIRFSEFYDLENSGSEILDEVGLVDVIVLQEAQMFNG